jgi:hypothetical protein
MPHTVGNRANSGDVVTSPVTIASFTVTEASPLYVMAVWQGTQTVTGVTWNGGAEAFEALSAFVASGGGQCRIQIWGLKNPTPATASVVATFSANPGGGAFVAVIGTTGGNTVTGWRTVYTRTDAAGTGPGRNVDDSENGDLVFHAAGIGGVDIVFDGSEVTTSTEWDNIAGSSFSGGFSTQTASGANTPVGCTDATFYAQIAFASMAAGGVGLPFISRIGAMRVA